MHSGEWRSSAFWILYRRLWITFIKQRVVLSCGPCVRVSVIGRARPSKRIGFRSGVSLATVVPRGVRRKFLRLYLAIKEKRAITENVVGAPQERHQKRDAYSVPGSKRRVYNISRCKPPHRRRAIYTRTQILRQSIWPMSWKLHCGEKFLWKFSEELSAA